MVKKTDDTLLRRIQAKARAGGFELAGQDSIERLRVQVNRVLVAMGFPGALVTDESLMGDFPAESLAKASEKLGVPIDPSELLTDVARKLML